MDNIGPNLHTGRGITEWTNDAADEINRKQVVHSNDFLLTKTPNGVKLGLKGRHKSLYEDQYKNEYSASAHYDVGDVVRVLSGSNYGVPASVGTWKCVQNVPDKDIGNARIANHVLPPADVYFYYIRDNAVEYFPKEPEPTELAQITTSSLSMAGKRFWERIGSGPRIKMAVCINGVEYFYLVDAFPSGSAPP